MAPTLWAGPDNSSDTASATITLSGASSVLGPSNVRFVGRIAELVVAERAVPGAAQVDKIFGYAAQHWGLPMSLPAAHPCEMNPPTL